MKYFKKNMHYLLVTLYLFSSQINAFSFDNNDLNIGIPISEKTSANKTSENREHNNLLVPVANAGISESICFGDSYQIGEAGDVQIYLDTVGPHHPWTQILTITTPIQRWLQM